jgi:hypothetical protein
MNVRSSIIILCLSILIFTAYKSEKENINTKIKKTLRPNIVFILADDYGIMNSRAYAHKFSGAAASEMFYETPNIHQLIEEEVAFSQAYANQLYPYTRASIMTGKYASRLGFKTAMLPKKTYYNQNITISEGNYAHDILDYKDNILIEQALINGTSNSTVPSGVTYDTGRDELSIT